MASNTSYPRRYYATTYTQLSTIPLKEGNVISVGDTDGLYYDISSTRPGSGDSVVRRKASAVKYVNSLQEATPEPEIIYIISNGTISTSTGDTIPKYTGYTLDTVYSTSDNPVWLEIFNNSQDFNVKNVVDNSSKIYFTGSTSNADDIGTLSKNTNIYFNNTNNKLHANLDGKADSAGSAEIAGKAQQDMNSVDLLTYIKGISTRSQQTGSSLIITHGDNTTEEISIEGTSVYGIYTENSPGLVDGWSTSGASSAEDAILCGNGWVDSKSASSSIHVASATSAEKDSLGNTISDHYLSNLQYNFSDRGLYTVNGAGTTSSSPIVTLPGVFTSSIDGLVPAASTSGDDTKFLRGDGTWQDMSGTIPEYSGSTPGLVPQGTGSTGTFLQEDGTWATSNTTGSFNSSNKLYIVGAPYQQSTSPVIDHTQSSTTDTITLDLSNNEYLSSLEATGQLAGYDTLLSIDGTEAWTISTTGTNYQEYDCTSLLVDNNSINNIIVSSMEVINTADVESITTIAWVQVADTTGRIVVNKTWALDQGIDIADIDTFTSYLANNSFTLWYQSSNYTSTSNQYYVAHITTSAGLYANVGTTSAISYLDTLDKIDFASGKVTRSDSTEETIYTNININYLTGIFTITASGASGWEAAWSEEELTSSAPTTYTNSNVYIDNDALYSNDKLVATLSDVSNLGSNIASAYSNSSTYQVGDYCLYDNGSGLTLYSCTVAVTTAEEFDSSKWSSITIIDALDSLWPVGSIYSTVTTYTTSPLPLPGTWTHIGVDTFLGENINYYKRIS